MSTKVALPDDLVDIYRSLAKSEGRTLTAQVIYTLCKSPDIMPHIPKPVSAAPARPTVAPFKPLEPFQPGSTPLNAAEAERHARLDRAMARLKPSP